MYLIAPIAAGIALVTAAGLYHNVRRRDAGTLAMRTIAQAVRQGAFTYLWRQYRLVGCTFAALFVVFVLLAVWGVQNVFTPLAFLSGGLGSALAGLIGMSTATMAAPRTAQGATEGLGRSLRVAFNGGAVMGLSVTGLALLDIALWFAVLDALVYTPAHIAGGWHLFGIEVIAAQPHLVLDGALTPAGERFELSQIASTMVTFGVGASLQALFARLGGGIYTKAADVGADLVGKVEAGIPEDDPRNPATIADNVGDNVGDVAGMGADLFESYYGSILATAALGAAVPAWFLADAGIDARAAVLAPLLISALGIFASILGIALVRTREGASQRRLLASLLIGTASAGAVVLLGAAALVLAGWLSWGLFAAIAIGLAVGVVIGQATEYYTAGGYRPVTGIAAAARMGPATTIIEGVAVGLRSTGIPVVTVALGILLAFLSAGGFGAGEHALLAGLYGVALAAVGMLATLGITLATDAYGPIADNAGGNAEMAGLPGEVRERTDALDALGNTTAATGKGFAIGSAALTALALLASYVMLVPGWIARAIDPAVGHLTRGGVTFALDADAATRATADGAAPVVLVETAGVADVAAAFDLSLINPIVIAGLFIGAATAFVFTALTMAAVGRAAGEMVEEVRRQFREIPDIMRFDPSDESPENAARRPAYAECVRIATASAQREMLVPALLAVATPVVTGLVLGVAGVVGLLAGALVAGFPLACLLNNAGGAWDNAKKTVEAGAHGGKYLTDADGAWVDADGNRVERREDARNPVHGATVIGDTVGDPFKDTAGPALNILIKLMAVVSVVFCGVTVMYGLL